MNKKHVFYQIFFWTLIILTSAIPILLFINVEKISTILDADKATAIDVILSLLPIVFSIILLILNYFIEYNKNHKQIITMEKEKTNEIIKNYNLLMLKVLTNYNTLMSELEVILNTKDLLKLVPELNEIFSLWEKETANVIDFSNNGKFRQFLREILSSFIIIFKKSNDYDSSIELLKNIIVVFNEYESFDIENRIFLYNLRNNIKFSKVDKNIIMVYSDLFSNGKLYRGARQELQDVIAELSSCYDSEVRDKTIDYSKAHSIVYLIVLKIFHYCEILLQVIFSMEEFINKMGNNFRLFYDKELKKYKKLDEYIKTEVVEENIFLKKYVKREVMYKHYKILE